MIDYCQNFHEGYVSGEIDDAESYRIWVSLAKKIGLSGNHLKQSHKKAIIELVQEIKIYWCIISNTCDRLIQNYYASLTLVWEDWTKTVENILNQLGRGLNISYNSICKEIADHIAWTPNAEKKYGFFIIVDKKSGESNTYYKILSISDEENIPSVGKFFLKMLQEWLSNWSTEAKRNNNKKEYLEYLLKKFPKWIKKSCAYEENDLWVYRSECANFDALINVYNIFYDFYTKYSSKQFVMNDSWVLDLVVRSKGTTSYIVDAIDQHFDAKKQLLKKCSKSYYSSPFSEEDVKRFVLHSVANSAICIPIPKVNPLS